MRKAHNLTYTSALPSNVNISYMVRVDFRETMSQKHHNMSIDSLPMGPPYHLGVALPRDRKMSEWNMERREDQKRCGDQTDNCLQHIANCLKIIKFGMSKHKVQLTEIPLQIALGRRFVGTILQTIQTLFILLSHRASITIIVTDDVRSSCI